MKLLYVCGILDIIYHGPQLIWYPMWGANELLLFLLSYITCIPNCKSEYNGDTMRVPLLGVGR